MGEHTPGPWHFSWSAAGCWLLYCSNDANAIHDAHFKPERKADVRLMAAAPELLGALQTLVDHADMSDDSRYGTLSASFVRDVCSVAIAKATQL